MTFVAPPEIIKALAISVANVTERYQRFRFSNYAVQIFVMVQFSKKQCSDKYFKKLLVFKTESFYNVKYELSIITSKVSQKFSVMRT